MPIRGRIVTVQPGRQDMARSWNALWDRSGRLPVSRWEHVLLWHRHFARSDRLIAIIVEDDRHWLAALPLYASRIRAVVPVWAIPGNEWSWSGELLWDQQADPDGEAIRLLLDPWRGLRRWWSWLDPLPDNTPGGQQVRAAIGQSGLPHRATHRYRIGQIQLRGDHGPLDMDSYQRSWSGNFRRQMRKMLKRAEERGGVELQLPVPESDRQVADLVRQGFAVEDQGWKNRAGTSVQCQPRVLEFFVEQAQQLARDGHLHLAFLLHRGQPIAFEYGWLAKGTYFSPKVGYDERFADLSPGQLLRYRLVEHLLARVDCHTYDFLGPLSEATAKWATRTYSVDRWICSQGSWWGNSALRAMATIVDLKTRWSRLVPYGGRFSPQRRLPEWGG